MVEFIDELMMYPRGKHDDLLDGFDLSTRKLIAPDHTVKTDEERQKEMEEEELKYFLRGKSQQTAWSR